MFGKSKLYERMLAEKQREIDWLREQIGRPTAALVPLPAPVAGADEAAKLATWMTEAEEAEAILASDPTLSAVHLPEILDGLGYGNSDLS